VLTDPTLDQPGRRYDFGWETGSRKLVGPALAVLHLSGVRFPVTVRCATR